ncbi:hypothetical protein KW784_02000 [Candidatus Parcubacteria bacterium]|nr:hypothetical protein [Candidatus Parcubacteria bacterium]
MFSFFVFILSGVALAALTLAKRFEARGSAERRKIFLLRTVSKGDARARDLYHKGLHFYSEGKHKFLFFMKKQLPAKARIYANKGITKLKEVGEERFGNIRNSRLIGKKEGISEFFKNISEVKKGAGELHDDVYIEEREEILAYRITPIAAPLPAPEEKKPRAPRKPRVKKLKVSEVIEY